MRRRATGCAVAFAALLVSTRAQALTPSVSIIDEPVAFAVRNVNTSGVSCASDGAHYTIRGHLVAPREALPALAPRTVTLYLHGLSYGEFFWHFAAVPGYDYAIEQARAGQASVVIDRLGYGGTDHPPGMQSCIGAQADIAHQIVGRLRNGTYVAKRAPSFQRVVVAGHSLGALVAQVEVSSFHDADALVVMSFSDTGSSPLATQTFAASGLTCAAGGQRAEGSAGPSGYAYFGNTPAQFRAAHFHDADPRVVQVATALRTRDPCGDYSSVPQALVTDQVALKTVTVPVLLVFGANDALFPPPAGERQKAMFSGSANVSLVSVPDTGHALALERSAPQFRAAVARWLQRL